MSWIPHPTAFDAECPSLFSLWREKSLSFCCDNMLLTLHNIFQCISKLLYSSGFIYLLAHKSTNIPVIYDLYKYLHLSRVGINACNSVAVNWDNNVMFFLAFLLRWHFIMSIPCLGAVNWLQTNFDLIMNFCGLLSVSCFIYFNFILGYCALITLRRILVFCILSSNFSSLIYACCMIFIVNFFVESFFPQWDTIMSLKPPLLWLFLVFPHLIRIYLHFLKKLVFLDFLSILFGCCHMEEY
jgi:hypothetical protein